MPNKMNKYGLKRLDILPCSLWILSWMTATPMPTSPYAKNVSKFQRVWSNFGEMADDDLKNAFDNIVEGIELDLNNFIHLGRAPSRQYGVEETTLSKLGWRKFLYVITTFIAAILTGIILKFIGVIRPGEEGCNQRSGRGEWTDRNPRANPMGKNEAPVKQVLGLCLEFI